MNYADRLKRCACLRQIEERYGKWLEKRNQGPLSDKEEKLIGELETAITTYERLLEER